MRIFSIEFDEYEKEALQTAIENDRKRLSKLWDRVLNAKSEKALPHPSEIPPQGLTAPAKMMTPKEVGTAIETAAEISKPAPPPAPVAAPEPKSAKTAYTMYDRAIAEKDGLDPLNPWDETAGEWRCCGSRHRARHLVNCLLNNSDGKLPPETGSPKVIERGEMKFERHVPQKPFRRKNGQTKEAALELHSEGKSNVEIADTLGCSRERIRQILKAEGLQPNRTPDVKPIEAEPEEEEKAEPEKPAPAPENDADASKSEADEDAEPKDVEEQEEDQQFVCRECGNTRLEPYGTVAIKLDCPNGWADDPQKHVYELKLED